MRERIRQLMNDQHMNQQSFAEKLKIAPASLSNIFNQRTEPTLKHVDAICRAFPSVNLQWLLFGEGPMYQFDETSPSGVPTPQGQPSPSEQMLDFSNPVSPAAPIRQNVVPHPSNYPNSADFQNAKIIDKPQRKITEIRIFYDDQTWETFVPKK